MQRPNREADAGAPDRAADKAGWSEEISTELCIIGAGSGGLSLAASAVQIGLRVVLIEKHKMGGDCLNYGCVPSKALLTAARRAHKMRTAKPFGIDPVEPRISHARVRDHVRGVIDAIAPNDSVERFTGLGVKVIKAAARFVDRSSVVAGDRLIRAERFCIATGSAPAVPPIPGLDTVPYFTNETIFDNDAAIRKLIVIGGGPIGLELAQAHRRLGSEVVVLEALKAMAKDDPELAAVVLGRLRAEGLQIQEGTAVQRVEGEAGAIRVTAASASRVETYEGTHLLVATGRVANVSGLDLEAAGITYDRRGIRVSPSLVTTNPKVFAIGDVVGGLQFTHMANYHAGIVFRQLLLGRLARVIMRGGTTVRTDRVPWVTYTSPELANVGLTEEEARKRHDQVCIYRWPMHENDRAQAERETEGFLKVVTDKKGRILGAGLVAEHAGEIIQMWSLAVTKGLHIKDMADWISPYPTLSEVNKRAALGYYAAKAGSPIARSVIGLLRKLG